MPDLGRDITPGDLDLSESREWLCTNGSARLREIFDVERAAAHSSYGRWRRRPAPGRNWRVARDVDSGKIAAWQGEPPSQDSVSKWR